MAAACPNRQSTRMRRRYTSEQRTQLLKLVADGDLTVPEAAARLGVTTSAAYNWTAGSRKLRTGRRMAAPTFVRLVPSAAAAPSIVVRVGGAEVHVGRGFDGELLQAVIATLAEGAR
jgi:transposase-like protein